MLRTLGKLVLLLGLGLIVGYCSVLYLDLRSYAVLKNLELQNKDSVAEKYHNYQWNSDNIFVFLQLSDIHVSLFRDPARVPDLRRFLATELRLIRPDVVVVSGDLTDAKLPDYKASRQYEEEWKIYHSLLQEFKVDEVTKWLDLRGNHDAFNIFSLEASDNFFSKYSRRGRESQRSYMHTLRKPFGQYSFVAMDAVPMPGPKRPYNFFGFLDTTAVLDAQRFARKSRASNQSFWFGHYPLSIIVSEAFDVHKFLGEHAYSYMCGHLHTLGGSVPHMYGLHPEGFLELELGDWMDNRLYRLAAVDNDLVTFSDLRVGTWPAVHVTNPKDARYLLPHKEPAGRLNATREIRILAFSPDPIVFVKVWLDGGFLGNATPRRPVAGLFALPWQPTSFHGQDLHQLEVRVRDASGRESRVSQQFSVSGRPAWQFGLVPSLILLGDVTRFLRLVFYSAWLGLFAPLIAVRVARYRFTDSLVQSLCCWIQPEITRGLYKFVLSDGLFYPWIVYFLYMGCGPLMFGYFVDDSFGVMFLNGLYIGGTWLPESFIYASEFIQLCAFHGPLLCLLCYRLGRPVAKQQPTACSRFGRLAWLATDCRHWVHPLLLWQLWLSANFLLATYGLSVFLLSPCRLWQVAFGWYLHKVVCRIEASMVAHCHG